MNRLVARFNQFENLVIRFRRQRLAREAIMPAKEISVKKAVRTGHDDVCAGECR
jgi:hypothetical protein